MSNVRALHCRNCAGKGYTRPLKRASATGLEWGNAYHCIECGPPANRTRGTHVPTDTLADIRSVPRYVNKVVSGRELQRLLHSFAGAQREEMRLEMIAQGSLAIYRLWESWKPDRCLSFADYCSTYLPKRIHDWWRTNERQSWRSRRNTTTGEYDQNTGVEFDENLDTEVEVELPDDGVIAEAIGLLPVWERALARRFAQEVDEGFSDSEVAEKLGVSRGDAARVRKLLVAAIREVQGVDEAA